MHCTTGKNKRIGILTFQRIENYGAALQCFALWYYLKEKGYDVEVIDLLTPEHCGYVKSNKSIRIRKHRNPFFALARFIYRAITRGWNHWCHRSELSVCRKRFESFFSLGAYSKQYSGFDAIMQNPPLYDIYITGSDQTWNPKIYFDWEAYFLTFAPKTAMKIAYAPSIAVKEIPTELAGHMKNWLADYSAISCREKSGIDIITELTGQTATLVADPTLLLSQEQWTKFAKMPSNDSKPYILCLWFCVGDALQRKIEFSKELKDISGKKVIVLPTPGYGFPKASELEIVFDAGPQEFIGLIAGADMVLTNSFHGTAFSALFARSFYVFLRNDSIDDRMVSLMHTLKMEDRIVGSIESIKLETIAQCIPVDREKLDDNLAKFRETSENFLSKALEHDSCHGLS